MAWFKILYHHGKVDISFTFFSAAKFKNLKALPVDKGIFFFFLGTIPQSRVGFKHCEFIKKCPAVV